MTKINIYEDTERKLEWIASRLDTSIAEVVDLLLENMDDEVIHENGLSDILS